MLSEALSPIREVHTYDVPEMPCLLLAVTLIIRGGQVKR